MLKRILVGTLVAAGVATAAPAQSGGSTYPAGSNLPQRSAGEIAPKPDAQLSGAGASAGPGVGHRVQGRKASRSGAMPHKKGAPVPQPGSSDKPH